MPDDLGPGSGAMYCDTQMKYHMDSFLGTKNCAAEEADMMTQQTIRSDKCIGTIINMSIIVECMQGSCPEEEEILEDATVAERLRKLVMQMHQSMLFPNPWTAMDA